MSVRSGYSGGTVAKAPLTMQQSQSEETSYTDKGTAPPMNDNDNDDHHLNGLSTTTTDISSVATSMTEAGTADMSYSKNIDSVFPPNIMTVNYHKTGHDFSAGLMHVLKSNQRGLKVYPHHLHIENGVVKTKRRTHTQTGCPEPLEADILRKGKSVFQNICPDLLCNQDDLSEYLGDVGKIIHFIRGMYNSFSKLRAGHLLAPFS